jgi:hypothetical protein
MPCPAAPRPRPSRQPASCSSCTRADTPGVSARGRCPPAAGLQAGSCSGARAALLRGQAHGGRPAVGGEAPGSLCCSPGCAQSRARTTRQARRWARSARQARAAAPVCTPAASASCSKRKGRVTQGVASKTARALSRGTLDRPSRTRRPALSPLLPRRLPALRRPHGRRGCRRAQARLRQCCMLRQRGVQALDPRGLRARRRRRWRQRSPSQVRGPARLRAGLRGPPASHCATRRPAGPRRKPQTSPALSCVQGREQRRDLGAQEQIASSRSQLCVIDGGLLSYHSLPRTWRARFSARVSSQSNSERSASNESLQVRPSEQLPALEEYSVLAKSKAAQSRCLRVWISWSEATQAQARPLDALRLASPRTWLGHPPFLPSICFCPRPEVTSERETTAAIASNTQAAPAQVAACAWLSPTTARGGPDASQAQGASGSVRG